MRTLLIVPVSQICTLTYRQKRVLTAEIDGHREAALYLAKEQDCQFKVAGCVHMHTAHAITSFISLLK